MAVARYPLARVAPPAPAIISASRARVVSNKGERGGLVSITHFRQSHAITAYQVGQKAFTDLLAQIATTAGKPSLFEVRCLPKQQSVPRSAAYLLEPRFHWRTPPSPLGKMSRSVTLRGTTTDHRKCSC
jgi:hypothetical protein